MKRKQKIFYRLILGSLIIIAGGLAEKRVSAERTVIDQERGAMYTNAFNNDWSHFGAAVYTGIESMKPEALKAVHGRMQHFSLFDDGQNALFPFNKFKAYEADEVAAGRNPFLVTATYQGKKREVFADYKNNSPFLQQRPVKADEDRFVKFWANEYVRKVEYSPYYQNLQNLWEGMDYCIFRYCIYGVLDDSGVYHSTDEECNRTPEIPWDSPFAQNSDEWLTQISTFYSKLKQYAPDLKVIANQGSLDVDSRYPEVFANVDGVMWEDTGGQYDKSAGSNWWIPQFYVTFNQISYLNSANKPIVARANLPAKTDPSYNRILTGKFLAYELLKTENSFFGPTVNGTEIDPAEYADIKNALGRPIEAPQSTLESGPPGYYQARLYSRKFEGGIVYLNWTGTKDKVVTLPTDRIYYDPITEQPVTQIIVPDVCQTVAPDNVPNPALCQPDLTIKSNAVYVVTALGKRAAVPTVSPNGGTWNGGGVTVLLESTTPGATIRYTINGSEPTSSSTQYTTPFQVNSTANLKAKSFTSGYVDSFSTNTLFTISQSNPTLEFYSSSDNGSEFLDTNYALVALSQPSSKTVTVNYSVSGGTATSDADYKLSNGTLTFKPGDKYRYFPIEIINDTTPEGDEAVQITLSSPTNASLGTKTTYSYTIQDNDNRSVSKGYLDVLPSADVQISNVSTSNQDSAALIQVGRINASEIDRGLFKFDLSSVPKGATVESAVLHTNVPYAIDDGDKKTIASAYRLLKDWKEREVLWTKSDSLNSWTSPGASAAGVDRAQTASAQANAALAAYEVDFNPVWDLTSDVQGMVNSTVPNYGWILVGPEGGTATDFFRTYSKEGNSTYIFEPHLMITYSVSTGPSAVDLNSDNLINQLDFDILKSDFLKLTASLANPKSDIDGDGEVSIKDVGIMMSGWR